ncbi:SACE_7040 family transcriptional regulator [Parafrankia elaeagni]|uniref:SACE_7040 family transcriptional regulator n=1 Tax=Parafrankia elaeagni TaxID=222534 RepID=UPI00039C88DA|nr:TetR/AcrR family transcriptional regulator [Parafrankia elaeagni]
MPDEEALSGDPEHRSSECTSTNPEVLVDDSESARPARSKPTPRSTRRQDLLRAAARLFAERGFRGVGIEQIGAAVGIRGPGIYRHFPSKDAVLVELLVGISRHLLDSARESRRSGGTPTEILDRLVRRHVDFALENPDLIVIQDRDLWSLPDEAEHDVRRLQRAYVEQWVQVLRQVRSGLDVPAARARVHALFGLINSTPHSASDLDHADMAVMLHEMAIGALRI